MKIGIVCYPTHGGSGVVASELALGLAERGHEVHIVSYATPFRLRTFSQNVFIHEVEVATYPLFKYPPYGLGLATKLAEVAEEYKLDLFHAHYAMPHAASAYIAKKIMRSDKLKIMTTLHGTDITLVGADKSFHRVIKFSIEESDGVTAVSKFLKQRTIEEFDIKREIRVIYNFVDTSRCQKGLEKCSKKRYAPAGEKILMHASNFRPVKRVSDVVRIFAKVREKIPSKLLLLGEGPERLFAQQLVKELKLSKEVFFLGEQDYIENLLSCADLFLLPSEQESFGLVALEALSCGAPVVGAATGGLPEVVVDGETGFLLPVGDVSGMAQKCIELLTNDELYQAFSRRGRERAVTCFERQLIIPQYEAYYHEILNG
jgi:N-acetyl-alpha-D-glucosaminyl L-malate synthase BshA